MPATSTAAVICVAGERACPPEDVGGRAVALEEFGTTGQGVCFPDRAVPVEDPGREGRRTHAASIAAWALAASCTDRRRC